MSHPLGVPTGALGHDIVEVMPSEINEIKLLMADIQRKYGGRVFDKSSDQQFTNEVTQRFAEIGFVVHIEWKDVDVDDHSDKLWFIPTLSVTGRTERVEIDHERLAREVQLGEADGKAGVLREDGTWSEDGKRTNIG